MTLDDSRHWRSVPARLKIRSVLGHALVLCDRLVASVSGRTISAQWTASFHARDYVGEAGTTPGGTDMRNGAIGSAIPAVTVSDVGVGTFHLRVRAKNTCGISGPSNEVVVVVR